MSKTQQPPPIDPQELQPGAIDDPEVLQHLDNLLRSSVQDLIADAFDLGACMAWIIRTAGPNDSFTISSSDSGLIATNYTPTGIVILFPYPIAGDERVEMIVPEHDIVSREKTS